MYQPLPFDQLNEADVREEVIAPLLRNLGYRSGTASNVIREQSLRYPRSFLGRRDPAKDPELRGKADYILEANNLVRWVIEAKPPSAQIRVEDIEQAWTYANHPEVRAVYFALCNGQVLQVFQTQHGPKARPILAVAYDRFEQDFGKIANLLGPDALIRDFPQRAVDTSPPIGPGLRSVVRITNGLIRYEHNSLGLAVLNELQTVIADGAVERDERGHLIAYLRTLTPLRSLQELNERLGLASFEMTSPDTELSINPSRPTRFVYENTLILPAGEQVLNIVTWQPMVLTRNLRCDVIAHADGVLARRRFSGVFRSRLNYIELDLMVDLEGLFDVILA
jgi:hypothetical protein